MFAIIEKLAVRRVCLSLVSLGVSWVMSHVSGHYGITVDPQALTAASFGALEYGRHLLVVKYPPLAPWLS